ncbi:hypothetical protein B0H19DRAFT_1062945 [Mycena capillaripes]|nr:hypothetical protein B0H19DRAFT_1062945 [Mycena capillaripes]
MQSLPTASNGGPRRDSIVVDLRQVLHKSLVLWSTHKRGTEVTGLHRLGVEVQVRCCRDQELEVHKRWQTGSSVTRSRHLMWTKKKFSGLAEDRIAVLSFYEAGETPSMRVRDNIKNDLLKITREVIIAEDPRKRARKSIEEYMHRNERQGPGYKSKHSRGAPAVSDGKHCQEAIFMVVGALKACTTAPVKPSTGLKAAIDGPENRSDSEEDLTTRERSFLRVLIYHDYQNLKSMMFPERPMFMSAHPGKGFFTPYDYTKGAVKISLQSQNGIHAKEVLGGPEWTDIVSRTDRSGADGSR